MKSVLLLTGKKYENVLKEIIKKSKPDTEFVTLGYYKYVDTICRQCNRSYKSQSYPDLPTKQAYVAGVSMLLECVDYVLTFTKCWKDLEKKANRLGITVYTVKKKQDRKIKLTRCNKPQQVMFREKKGLYDAKRLADIIKKITTK